MRRTWWSSSASINSLTVMHLSNLVRRSAAGLTSATLCMSLPGVGRSAAGSSPAMPRISGTSLAGSQHAHSSHFSHREAMIRTSHGRIPTVELKASGFDLYISYFGRSFAMFAGMGLGRHGGRASPWPGAYGDASRATPRHGAPVLGTLRRGQRARELPTP